MNSSGQQNSGIPSETSILTVYICGSCGVEQEIRPRDQIICKECSGRIFYKKRLKKSSQYEAR